MPRPLPGPVAQLAFIIGRALELIHLPASPQRDYIINYLRHVAQLRRTPKKQLLLNDVLFRIKTGRALRRELAAHVSDKELIKGHIADRVGAKYNIPTLAILTTPAEIDAYEFPAACIIKPTHASGRTIRRRAGEPIDRKKIRSWLKLNYYAKTFEPNYRDLVPKVIVEPWVFDRVENMEIMVYCVAGKARSFIVVANEQNGYAYMTYDRDWNEMPVGKRVHSKYKAIQRPRHLDKIIEIAEGLAAGTFMIRIDFYYDGNTIICGEITNCPAAALKVFDPRDIELIHSRILFSELAPEDCERFFTV